MIIKTHQSRQTIQVLILFSVCLLILPMLTTALPPNSTQAWEFEEASGNFADSGSGGYTGTTSGSYTYQQSPASGGSNLGYCVLSSATTYASTTFTGIQTGDFSAELWFQPEGTQDRLLWASSSGTFGGLRINYGAYPNFTLWVLGNVENYYNISTYVNVNVLHHYFITRSGDSYSIYIDGNFIGSSSQAGSFDNGNFRIGFASSLAPVGKYCALRLWDGTALNAANVSELYNAGNGLAYPFMGALTPAITYGGLTPANQSNLYQGDTLTINTTAENFGGTNTTSHFLYNGSGSLILQYNHTGSASFITNYTGLTPGAIYFFNATNTNSSNTTTTETRQINITRWNAYLNISILSGGVISSPATINLTDQNTSWFQQFNTSTGSINAQIAKGNNYSIVIDASGYAFQNDSYQANQTAQQYKNISLFGNNSISINIYDETTGIIITQNITIVFSGSTEDINTTSNGSLYERDLTDGTWTIKFSGQNYSLKQYTAEVSGRSHQYLNAYLTSSNSTSIFTIQEEGSGSLIQGATFTQQRLINGTWTTINSKSSDITGRVQITYIPNVLYFFIVSKTGYQTNSFTLNPILFSSYNVRLTKIQAITPPTTPSSTAVSISYYNTTFFNNANNTLIWIISSPAGALLTYRLNVSYPGGENISTGSNLYGATFTNRFQITGTNTTDRVIISYCYNTTTSHYYCFRYPYTISGAYGNTTMLSNADQTYGLGIFERALITTIIVLIVSGVAFLYAGPIAGLALAIFLYAFFVYQGFIPVWITIPGAVVGIFILFRGGNK